MTALEKSLETAVRYLAEAESEKTKAKQYDVAACVGYLEAANAAMAGLEDELDEILVETAQVVRFEWENKDEIFKRINSYLNRDRLETDSRSGTHRYQIVS